jgi:DNA-directed RNA polymerase subunit RPC12/RpoP
MVEQRIHLCEHCRHTFKLPTASGDKSILNVQCPKCGSSQIIDAPAWAPLGSGANIFDGSMWKYECQKCGLRFEMPIPKSPSEEKGRRCPQCGQGHLHLMTDLGAQPLYCG